MPHRLENHLTVINRSSKYRWQNRRPIGPRKAFLPLVEPQVHRLAVTSSRSTALGTALHIALASLDSSSIAHAQGPATTLDPEHLRLAAEFSAKADGLDDGFERRIIDHDPDDDITTLIDVRPREDFDSDGVINLDEFLAGTDPTRPPDGPPVIDPSRRSTWLPALAKGWMIGR